MKNDNDLQKRAIKELENINSLVRDVKEAHKENEQYFLDFLDEMNKISVIW